MTKAIPTDRHITYAQQPRKCGKPNCKNCANGPGHGPYWYGYWRNKGEKKMQTHYFGKTDPRSEAEKSGVRGYTKKEAVNA